MRLLYSLLFSAVGLFAGFLLGSLAGRKTVPSGESADPSEGKPRLSVRTALVAALTALLFPAFYLKAGLTLALAVDLILCCCLIFLSLTDLEIGEIPDLCLLIPALCRLAQLFIEGGVALLLKSLLLALCPAAACLLFVLLMDRLMKKESMGGGDVKLIFLFSLFFSLSGLVLVLALACLIVLAIFLLKRKKPSEPFAFGPALSAAAILLLLLRA